LPTYTFLAPAQGTGTPLTTLFQSSQLVGHHGEAGPLITSVSVNDREVEPGALFVALPGQHSHGAQFAQGARDRGAVAVMTDPTGAGVARASGLPVAVVTDARRAVGDVASRVYGTDEARPRLFGVTGTNGKTTTVHLLDALLELLGVRAGHSSTESRRSGDAVIGSRLTSPEAPELHALLARMNEDAVKEAAIEVSAQAITHHRFGGIVLDVAGFTNLSHDHLDEYGSMGAYLHAKATLFRPEHARAGVVSLDSPAGRDVVAASRIPVSTISSTPGVDADWSVHAVRITPTTTNFELSGPGGLNLRTSIPLLGRHMAADCGLALAMLATAGHDLAAASDRLAEGLHVDVPGRTTLISGSDGPRVYVDFSHTPDSIEKTLTALRAVAQGPVVVVMGADGERDTTKRRPMGAAAANGADVAIITDHHSRFEDPTSIREALLAGARTMTPSSIVLDIADSAEAIRTAIDLASPDGTVLWSGPGNVDYRIIRGADVPYSPRQDAARALAEAGWASPPAPHLT